MTTLADFYDLMNGTTTLRRMLVEYYLAGTVKVEEVAGLRRALDVLEEQRTADGRFEFRTKPDGRRTRVALDYETQELEKDLFFFEHGEEAFHRYVADRTPGLDTDIRAVTDLLRPTGDATFVSDRDGTVNNYCGRYRSSVQSTYNAVFLTRFLRRRTGRSAILTSAPLEDFGIVDLTVMPTEGMILAGSKGREFTDEAGRRHSLPIEADKQTQLTELNNRLSLLLERPEYEEFGLIGSALQQKFGQTTVARQDIYGSIDPERSEAFLERIRALVAELDPAGETFRIEDTGYDIEIILTRAQGDRDFNKGDGIDFMNREAGLDLDGPVVVCGDTPSDLPMAERAARTSTDLRTVFVTRDDELRRRVEEIAPQSVFVGTPDALVLAVGALGKEEAL